MKKITQKIKKLITLTIVLSLILTGGAFSAIAVEPPSAPVAPDSGSSAPVAPEAPSSPSSENSTSQLSEPEPEPSSPEAPSTKEELSTNPSNPVTETSNSTDGTTDGNGTSNANAQDVGDTLVKTGDATNNTSFSTFGNNNLSSDGADIEGADNTTVANIGNGNESDNSASLDSEANSNTIQNNNASVGNSLSQNATTGKNDASQNVGDSVILTGDANTSGTIVTGVNTNFDGISVSEFQVADVHTGDLVLDFAANCIINCVGDILARNTGNGSDSTNNASIDSITNDNTFQNNDASVESNLTLASNSGANLASQNTNGDSFIQTGDANVSGNVLTFANNNFTGNVLFGVVDIFGTLNGDIVLTDEAIAQATGYNCSTCSGSDINASNVGNGSNSDNNASVNQETNNTTLQTNDANIQNNLNLAATTGENTAEQNTGGDTFIQTGNSDINAQTINIANSNVDGGNWWLVIVNKAGEWVGQLLGAPVGSLLAGSEDTEFSVNENGEITATNSGNGSNSTNNAAISQEANNTTAQTNNADIVNNVNLSANTGGNDVSQNTGGSNTIKTGDAKIIANLVNFVNNNVVGGQKLIVTVVNVFGSWFGDFVTPGQQKNSNENQDDNLASNSPNVGGPSSSDLSNNNSSENNSPNQSQNSVDSSINNNSSSTANNDSTSLVSNPSNSSNPTFSSDASSPKLLKVAGISSVNTFDDVITDEKENNPKNKGISINLAWVLVLIPAGLAYVIIKRKLNPLKFLSRKSI